MMSDLIPHEVCLASSPDIIGLIIFSNFSIALACFVIPSILAIAVSRFRMHVPAIKALFAVFITGCGGTYVMDIVTMYLGGSWYWGQVTVLLITAAASLTVLAVLLDVLLRPNKWFPHG
jgi:hypothetical protein